MADTDDAIILDEIEVAEDNAKELTSGLVITTFAVMLVAILVMQLALDKWFAKGLFGP